MSELKPCPFCGGKARIREYKAEKFLLYNANCFISQCGKCGCGTSFERSQSDAIIAWNTRQSRFSKDEINALRNVLDFAKDGSEMAYENDLMVSCDQEHADCVMNVANQAIATVREMLTKGNSKKIGRR